MIFPHIIYQIVPYARDFLPIKVFQSVIGNNTSSPFKPQRLE